MARVKCPKCFHVNPSGKKQCERCQAPLPRITIEAHDDTASQALAQAVQFRQGQVLANRYTIAGMVGRGGMGCIYRVRDNVLGEEVALKTLLPQFGQDELVMQRFFNEARIARRLAHPNIVRVHDIGNSSGIVYISMEYVKGQSLRGLLDAMPKNKRLPLNQTLAIMEQLCSALEYAHQYTIHRDIKPENVMLDEFGAVKLMDFGISKLMADTRLTGASIVMGTPFYMSPEQVRNSRDVDARSDIYSVGVVLYEILTGNVPTGIPRPASQISAEIPEAMDGIVLRCVEPDPAKRYQNVRELRGALDAVRKMVDTGEIRGDRPITTQTHRPRRSKRRAVGIALALLILAAMGAALYVAEGHRHGLADHVESGQVLPAGVFGEIKTCVERLRDLPETKEILENHPPVKEAWEYGEERWGKAMAQRDNNPDAALRLAREALQCYMALHLWEEGLVFVPPGNVNMAGGPIYVAPFLMQTKEVTLGEFDSFCTQVPGAWDFPAFWVPYKEHKNLPITTMTFYDAQAYAACRGMRLPTQFEWARAAYGDSTAAAKYPWGKDPQDDAANVKGGIRRLAEVGSYMKDYTPSGCFDMAGNAAEWTCSPAQTVEEDAALFGVNMVVCGGDFKHPLVPLTAQRALPYEHRGADEVGFRCVRPLPAHPAAARRLLDRRGWGAPAAEDHPSP